jgi:hypothetical protein
LHARAVRTAEAITQQLLFHKPNDPTKFLLQLLDTYKGENGTARPLMTDQDFRTMFATMDITKRGGISCAQANTALTTVMGPGASFAAAGLPELPPFITDQTFVDLMQKATKVSVPYNFSKIGLLPRPGAAAAANAVTSPAQQPPAVPASLG